jgi:hypothetical protein
MSPPALHSVETAMPAAAHVSATEVLVAGLRHLVRDSGRRWKVVLAAEAVGLAVSAPLAYLWLVCLLDNQLHLPTLGRLLASLGLVAGLAWAGRHLARRWRSLRLSEDQVALAIERRTPGQLQNRLINAVQIARETNPASAELSEAVVQENYQHLHQMRLEQAAQVRPALLRVGLALALVGVGLGYWLWQPEQLSNAAARIFLPLAPIDPLYRTRLDVAPGDVEAAGDVAITVTIHDERPETLTFFRRQQGKLITEVVPVAAGQEPVMHTFHDVSQGFTYAVRGGDFTSPYYQVTVPQRPTLVRVRVRYHYPEYTGLGERTVDSSGGDLEALQGTRARLTFVFDQPLDRVSLLLDRPAARGKSTAQALECQAEGREFTGEMVLEDVFGYRLLMVQGDGPAQRSAPFTVRVVKDQPPKLKLIGLEERAEVAADVVLPLQVVASDDFGLVKVGLFLRRIAAEGDKAVGAEEGWQPVPFWQGKQQAPLLWLANGQKELRQKHDLALASLGVAEGEKLELALRGVDTDPLRKGAWTTGAIYQLAVGGEGVALQLRYEQILRTENELKAVTKAEEELLTRTVTWLRKLDGSDGLRWDDAKNIDALHAGVKELARAQEKVRTTMGQTAKAMAAEAGNLRISVAMLADTEMVRLLRILDSVPGRDQPQAKRAALADGRLTQERMLRSLQEIQEQYGNFRSDWELSHMIPFTKMLAERQAKMRDQSRKYAGQVPGSAPEFERRSVSRRQQKVLDLCLLIQPAFGGLAARLQDQEATLAKAFREGADTLAGAALQQPLRQAVVDAGAGRWGEAARQQSLAADALAALHSRLRQAQAELARRALAALKEKAHSDLQAQKELEKLQAGSAESHLKDFDELKIEDLMRIRDVVGARKGVGGTRDEPDFSKIVEEEVSRSVIELQKDSGVRQDPYTLTLGKEPEKTKPMDMYKGKERNTVKPFMQEKFDDLVGKLLEETEDLYKNYQTINLSTNRNNNDGGDIGKIGGKLNSTGAVTATGNKKPPTLQSGGLARTGRQGARAYGMVADQDTYNRRGRDQALEGEQQVADQAGKNKMHETDDMQKDLSTGVGGKKIESNDSHFSLHDAGKWKDEYAKRLEKPQKKQYIVERQGDKIDARTAALLRDLTSKQEQVIERLKSIKKELRNLYLPTEHLDDMAAALQAGLATLKERPEPDLFRLQMQRLDRLRGALRVFQTASASFQPSLPRERALRGRVLDEPARPVIPGYEEAVKQYHWRLATQ